LFFNFRIIGQLQDRYRNQISRKDELSGIYRFNINTINITRECISTFRNENCIRVFLKLISSIIPEKILIAVKNLYSFEKMDFTSKF